MSGVHEIGGIGDWLEVHAHWRPRREALVDREERLDYGRLNSRVNRLAQALIARGVRKNDRVAAILPNSTAFLEALFACARLGAIFVPINFRLSPAEVRFILRDAGVHVIIYHALFAPLLVPIRKETEILHGICVPNGGAAMSGDDLYESVLENSADHPVRMPVGQDDVHAMMYTSGTTGAPKGALLTHGNTTWNAVNLQLSDSALRADDVVLTVAPLFHIGAFGIHTLPALYLGAKIVLHPRFDATETLELVERERVSALFLVPSMWLAISQHPDVERYDLSSLRTLISGGAPCPVPVIEFFQRRGLNFQEGFGMTETAELAGFVWTDSAAG